MPRSALTCLLVLAACSEYDFHHDKGLDEPGDKDSGVPVDSASPGTTPEGECPEADLSRGEVSIDESCEVEAIVGSWSPVAEWTDTSVGAAYATPVVGNLTDDDGDGTIGSAGDIPDIVVVNTSGQAVALSGDGSGHLWTININSGEPSTPAIGDLDGDGRPDVVFSGAGGFVAVQGETGSIIWTSASNANMGAIAYCGGAAIHDLDGDGKAEVIQGNYILNGQSGTLRGKGAYGQGTIGSYYSMGVAADIDQDGDLEVVVGNALYDADGNTIWYNGQRDGFVAVGNFDSDPYGEIVVTENGNVRLQDDDGTVLWSGNFTSSRIGPPTIADFDGDGQPEIGVAGFNSYVVIEGNGTLLWKAATQDVSSGVTGSAVFDFEGDGAAEAVYADETTVWVFDGATGAVKLSWPNHSSATCTEYPAIADVDNDGHAEIAYVSDPYGGKAFTGLTVLGDANDSWMAGSKIWNQHAYWITNVEQDGTVPANPDTNWLSYNNFRSGDMTAGSGGVYPDAVPEIVEICTEECDEERLRVVVRVGNAGMDDLPVGVSIAVYGSYGAAWVLLETRFTSEVVASGDTTEGMVFDLNPKYVDASIKVVVADDPDSAFFVDCHSDNDSVESSAVCP